MQDTRGVLALNIVTTALVDTMLSDYWHEQV
jgi:hypothetical protein